MCTRVAVLVAFTVAACARAGSTPAPTPVTLAMPTRPDASAPPPAPHPQPEADPEVFRADTETRDVDGDGLPDRVRRLPMLQVDATPTPVPVRLNDVPVLVAHGLSDGRYALDDEVTRAALRAACPDRRWQPPPGGASGLRDMPEGVMASMFWSGFCARAWGASADEGERVVRASAQTFPADLNVPGRVDAVVRAVREVALPITLLPHDPVSLSHWRPTPATQTSPADAPPPPVGPVDARCAAVRARNRAQIVPGNRAAAAWARAHPDDGGNGVLNFDNDPGHCLAGAAGVWSLVLAPSRFVSTSEIHVEARTTLTWTPARGRAMTLSTPFMTEAADMASTYPGLEGVYDWDGDGMPEVVLRVRRWAHEDSPESPITLFTLRDGAVRPYAPAQGYAHILSVEDVDHDGRPDLLLPSPWHIVDACGLDGIPHDGPSLVAHSLPDGTFSTRDDVARAWVMRRCARAEHDRHTLSVDVVDVACARAWGQDADAVVSATWPLLVETRGRDAERAGNDEACLSAQELAAMALIAPPFAPLRDDLAPLRAAPTMSATPAR